MAHKVLQDKIAALLENSHNFPKQLTIRRRPVRHVPRGGNAHRGERTPQPHHSFGHLGFALVQLRPRKQVVQILGMLNHSLVRKGEARVRPGSLAVKVKAVQVHVLRVDGRYGVDVRQHRALDAVVAADLWGGLI